MNLIASILFDCGFTIRKGIDYCDTQTFVVETGDPEYSIQVVDLETNNECRYMFMFKHSPQFDFIVNHDEFDSTYAKVRFSQYVELIRVMYASEKYEETRRCMIDLFEDLCEG